MYDRIYYNGKEWGLFKLMLKKQRKSLIFPSLNGPRYQKNIRRKIMAQTLLEAPSLAFVCFFGIAVVFVGLVILIGLVYLMNFICDKLVKEKAPKSEAAPVVSANNDVIPNREELVAAICAAIAEEEGTDISAIRVVSIKKV